MDLSCYCHARRNPMGFLGLNYWLINDSWEIGTSEYTTSMNVQSKIASEHSMFIFFIVFKSNRQLCHNSRRLFGTIAWKMDHFVTECARNIPRMLHVCCQSKTYCNTPMPHEINFLLMYTGVRPDMQSQFGLGLSENALTQCSASSPFHRIINAVVLCSWFLLLKR